MTTARHRIHIGALLIAAGALALAGCASADSVPAATQSAAQEAPAEAGGQGQMGGGITGEIAAVSDDLIQVNDGENQTSVSFSTDTTITSTVAASLEDVAVGVCVSVTTSADDETTAATVAISDPVDGECAAVGGPGGGGSGAPSGMPTDAPASGDMPDAGDMPSGAPTGAPGADGSAGGFAGFGGRVSGLVGAVSGSTITVESANSGTDADSASSDVTVTDDTTFTTQADADADALTVGSCAVVRGEADDSGAVVATSIAVSEAGDTGCQTFGAGGGAPAGGAGTDD